MIDTGLTITIESNAIRLSASDDLREELREHADDYPKRESILYDSIEPYSRNGSWSFIQPADVGALTSAPMIAQEACPLESGEMQVFGIVAWFPDYTVRDPWQELADTGCVLFPIAATIN